MNQDQLKQKILDIDPFCNINFDYFALIIKDNDIDIESYLDNWRNHLDWWESEYGQKDKKWLKADERAQRKDPIEFYETDFWRRDWNVQKVHQRDAYLFPPGDINQINQYIKDVNKTIETERARILKNPS